jgi:hypothetical protein
MLRTSERSVKGGKDSGVREGTEEIGRQYKK